MIEVVVEGTLAQAVGAANRGEAEGWEVLSLTEGNGFLITFRKRAEPAPLGSHLQKALRLAVATLEPLGEVQRALTELERLTIRDRLAVLTAVVGGNTSPEVMNAVDRTLARIGR